MSDKLPTDKAELLVEVDRTWTAVNDALDELEPEQYTAPTDPQGWGVRDHLTHMGAWNYWAVYVMQGKPTWEAMGIPEELYRAGDGDAVNAAIQAMHARKSPAEARAYLQASHDHLMGKVAAMSDEELAGPFRPLRADEPPDRVIPPALHVVYETTADHYSDHLAWFQALAAGAATLP